MQFAELLDGCEVLKTAFGELGILMHFVSLVDVAITMALGRAVSFTLDRHRLHLSLLSSAWQQASPCRSQVGHIQSSSFRLCVEGQSNQNLQAERLKNTHLSAGASKLESHSWFMTFPAKHFFQTSLQCLYSQSPVGLLHPSLQFCRILESHPHVASKSPP